MPRDYDDELELDRHFDSDKFNRDVPYDDYEDYYYEDDEDDDEPRDFMTDAEADADVLKSAGMGIDEDYGYFDYGGES